MYVRYAADADWTLKDYEWVKFDLGLEVGSTDSAEKLSADAHIETQVTFRLLPRPSRHTRAQRPDLPVLTGG